MKLGKPIAHAQEPLRLCLQCVIPSALPLTASDHGSLNLKRPHDACIAILATIGKAPLPSLRIVTAQLAETIQNIKVSDQTRPWHDSTVPRIDLILNFSTYPQGVSSSNERCAALADTLCRFQFLVNTVGKLDKTSQAKVEKPFHNALKQVER
jgi:hypothetical protein